MEARINQIETMSCSVVKPEGILERKGFVDVSNCCANGSSVKELDTMVCLENDFGPRQQVIAHPPSFWDGK